MSETSFPAPVLVAPTADENAAVAVPAPSVALSAPSADDARTTAEHARTVGANVPSGLAPKPVVSANGERILIMPYAGHDFEVYAHKFTGEVIEWQEVGLITRAVKELIGVDQWNMIKGWHARDIKKFADALGGLDLLGK